MLLHMLEKERTWGLQCSSSLSVSSRGGAAAVWLLMRALRPASEASAIQSRQWQAHLCLALEEVFPHGLPLALLLHVRPEVPFIKPLQARRETFLDAGLLPHAASALAQARLLEAKTPLFQE